METPFRLLSLSLKMRWFRLSALWMILRSEFLHLHLFFQLIIVSISFFRITLSMISERTNSLVKSLRIEVKQMSLLFEILLITVTIEMSNGTKYNWKLDSDHMPEQVVLVDPNDEDDDEGVDWTKPGYTLKEWFNHFYEITHTSQVACLMMLSGQFDFELVKELVPRTDRLCLYSRQSEQFNLQAFKTYLPFANRFAIDYMPFENEPELFQCVLMQNLETLDILWSFFKILQIQLFLRMI